MRARRRRRPAPTGRPPMTRSPPPTTAGPTVRRRAGPCLIAPRRDKPIGPAPDHDENHDSPMPTKEHDRLREITDDIYSWRRWGPYVSDRAWATVREDYSA